MLRWSAAKSSSLARTAASWATRGSSRRRASSTEATSPRRMLERWRTSSTGTTSVATNIPPPGPRRTVSSPASTSTAIASRSVGRLISICAASARSPGSLSPTRSSPARTFSAICSAASSNVRRVRTGSNIARAVYARWSGRWTSEQSKHQRDQAVVQLGQPIDAAGADLLGDELGDGEHEHARDEVGLRAARPARELLEHRAEARVLAVALLQGARPGRGQLHEVGAGERGALLPPAQGDGRAPAHRPPPGVLGPEGEELVEHLAGELVAQCEEAVGLVAEQLVERVARHAGGGHHRGDGRRGVAVLGDALEHRGQQPLALRGAHDVRRQRVATPRQYLLD